RLAQADGSSLADGLFAAQCQAFALAALSASLPHLALGAGDARRLAAELSGLRLGPDEWRALWAGEHRPLARTLELEAGGGGGGGAPPQHRAAAAQCTGSRGLRPEAQCDAGARRRLRARAACGGGAALLRIARGPRRGATPGRVLRPPARSERRR